MGVIIEDCDRPKTFQDKNTINTKQAHMPLFVKQLEKKSKAS